MAKVFVNDLGTYIRAGYPIITIVSSEEDRALEQVEELLGRKEMFAGLLGESEERMRKALAVAEGVAPCVLWIDELEKGLAGIGGSGDSVAFARP